MKHDFEQLATYTATPGEGCTRLPFSVQAEQAKRYIADSMRSDGFETVFDGVGNIRVKFPGSSADLPRVIIESHIDSVFNGGNYDGMLGVLCGMQVFRMLKKRGIVPRRDILLVGFDGEEGCLFPSPYIGSRLVTGSYDLEDMHRLRTPDGLSYYDAAARAGYRPEAIGRQRLDTGTGQVIELHVEQGNILDEKNISVGVVTSIAGFKRFNVRLKGKSAHPGATPMHRRRDPMVGAAHIMSALHEAILQPPFENGVLTFGKIECRPNAVNIIPEEVLFTIDMRHSREPRLGEFGQLLQTTASDFSSRFGLELSIEETSHSAAVPMSDRLCDLISETAEQQKIEYIRMISGAGHDITSFDRTAETAMLFLPSVDGISHAMEEFTGWKDIETGCKLLLELIVQLTG